MRQIPTFTWMTVLSVKAQGFGTADVMCFKRNEGDPGENMSGLIYWMGSSLRQCDANLLSCETEKCPETIIITEPDIAIPQPIRFLEATVGAQYNANIGSDFQNRVLQKLPGRANWATDWSSTLEDSNCMHTLQNSWWKASLDGTYQVTTVRTVKRTDCCGDRTSAGVMTVGENESDIVFECTKIEDTAYYVDWDCTGAVGDEIVISSSDYINFCGFEAWGIPTY